MAASKATSSPPRPANASPPPPTKSAHRVVDLCASDDEPEVLDLVSESDDSVLDLTAAAETPSTPARERGGGSRRRTAAANKRDWEAADARHLGEAHWMYVLKSRTGGVYTGCTSKPDDDALVADHAAGSRKSTRGKGPFEVFFCVGPFRNLTAAHRFECLVKRRGNAKGPLPKLAAARRALLRSACARTDRIVISQGGP